MLNELKRPRKWRFLIVVALLILIVAWIFGNSILPPERSRSISDSLADKIRPLIERLLGEEYAREFDVRKPAHFIEFAALGAGLALMIIVLRKLNLQSIVNIWAFGLATAVTDESIQLLTGRGPMVQDILLNFGGILFGSTIVLLTWALARFAFKRR